MFTRIVRRPKAYPTRPPKSSVRRRTEDLDYPPPNAPHPSVEGDGTGHGGWQVQRLWDRSAVPILRWLEAGRPDPGGNG